MSVTYRVCRPTDEDMLRFWPKVEFEPNSGCWLWSAAEGHGYGQFGLIKTNGGVWPAHVVSFSYANGPVPMGTLLHHKCETTLCVNPNRLEVSTDKFNGDYAMNACAVNVRKTHCPKGHEYTPENTRIVNLNTGGSRRCKTCESARARIKYQKRKEALGQLLGRSP